MSHFGDVLALRNELCKSRDVTLQSRRALPPDAEADDGDELVSSAEACDIADVNRSTLIRWVEKEVVTPVHKAPGPNGAYVFRRSEIRAAAALRKRQRDITRSAS